MKYEKDNLYYDTSDIIIIALVSATNHGLPVNELQRAELVFQRPVPRILGIGPS